METIIAQCPAYTLFQTINASGQVTGVRIQTTVPVLISWSNSQRTFQNKTRIISDSQTFNIPNNQRYDQLLELQRIIVELG